MEQYDHEELPTALPEETCDSVLELNEKLQKQVISTQTGPNEGQQKQNKCNTCNVSFEDAKLYREHHKSEWHKHNMKPKARQLPLLAEEECMATYGISGSSGVPLERELVVDPSNRHYVAYAVLT